MFKKSISLTIALCGLAACTGNGNNGNGDKGDMAGNNNGGGNFTVLSATVTLAAGQGGCANGGVQVNIGLDNGDGGGVARDGTLQDGEIDTNKVVCNTAPTLYNTVTLQTPVGLGDAHCMFGGTQIDYGLDNGEGGGTAGNGMLEPGERDGTTYACLQKPANLLIISTPLYPGDPQCQFGGQLITSGLDDGQPGGTANDGKLDQGEFDTTLPHCNPAPQKTFPTPTGTLGTGIIDVSGGSVAGDGTFDYSGGQGGSIELGAYGGPVPIAIEAYKSGTATPNTTVTKPTFVAGAHPVEISADTTIPFVDLPAEGLHIRLNATSRYESTLYDGDAIVTSLHVQAGKTLTFYTDGSTDVYDVFVEVQGDVRNEGTITARGTSEGDYTAMLSLLCHHFINEAGGAVDQRASGDYKYAGAFDVWAVFGGSGEVYLDKDSVVRADGWNLADGNGLGATVAASIQLVAAGNVYVGGQIFSDAGDAEANDYNNPNGADVYVRTLHGNIVFTGDIDASAVRGNQGRGGTIAFFNGPRGAYFESSPAGILEDRSLFGPGSFNGTGTLHAVGGDRDVGGEGSGQQAGSGGNVTIRMMGGNVESTVKADVSAGSYDDGSTTYEAGRGGNIFIGAFAWAGLVGEQPVVVPDSVRVSGDLIARGGGSGASDAQGGHGGDVSVVIDLVLAEFRGGLIDNTDWFAPQHYPTAQLSAIQKPVRLQLLGYGNNFHAEGGAGAYQGGSGGFMYFDNRVCTQPDFSCVFNHIGARLISHDVEVFANGGAATGGNSYTSGGGEVQYAIDNHYNAVSATIDAEQILIGGALTASGNDGTNSGQSGGEVLVQCDACDIAVSKDITVTGGSVDGEANGAGGGNVELDGFSVVVSSTINLDGGASMYFTAGQGGYFNSSAFLTKLDGKIQARRGGRVWLTSGYSLAQNGEIDCDGFADQTNVRVNGVGFTNSGMIHARGNDNQSGKSGGYVEISTTTFTNTGTIDVSGGAGQSDSSTPYGGVGGTIEVNSQAGAAGTLLARGGDGTSTDTEAGSAQGGAGGQITCYTPGDVLIDVSGGASHSTPSGAGGQGGTVYMNASNAGAIKARGGAADIEGGLGGTVIFDPAASNSGCVDVSGGAGDSPGNAGTIDPSDLPNFCS